MALKELTSAELHAVSGGLTTTVQTITVTEVHIINGQEVFVRVTYYKCPGASGWSTTPCC